MRIDNLQPGAIVTLGFCGDDKRVHTEESAVFIRHENHTKRGLRAQRRAVFVSLDHAGNNSSYEWSAYRYKGGWAYGTSAQSLRLISLNVPGPSIPEEYPVKELRTPAQIAKAADPVTDGACGRTWDDGVVTGMTPTPGGRCPFESFHAAVNV